MQDGWGGEIGECFHPYLEIEGVPSLVLEQTSDNHFRLVSGFSYRCGNAMPIHLAPGSLEATDLASVPRSLQWMVGSYGRHSFAALLHDALLGDVVETDRSFPDDPWDRRVEIDGVFHEALVCLGVPRLLSRLMWAAVTIKSRWGSTFWRKLLTVLWLSAVLAGTSAMIWGILNGRWDAIGATLVLPIFGAVLWGKGFVAGLYAGYGVVFVALPTTLGWASAGVHKAVQRAASSMGVWR